MTRPLPKVQPLVAQIGWNHNLIILQRCKDPLEREFYIRMTKKFGWTKNVLIHQIENQNYEKTPLGQTNFDKALTPKQRVQAKLAVKNEYTCCSPRRKLPNCWKMWNNSMSDFLKSPINGENAV